MAKRLGIRSVRKGAAAILPAAGGSFAQSPQAGRWHFSLCRRYVDVGVEETTAMDSVPIEASDDEGPGRAGEFPTP